MSEMINLRLLELGTKIGSSNGSTAEVLSNPLDGMWVFARCLSSPSDASLVGPEEMVFAQDIVEVLERPSPRVSPDGPRRRKHAPRPLDGSLRMSDAARWWMLRTLYAGLRGGVWPPLRWRGR